ncbi:Nucleoside triphosphate pyrophosphohydrolase (plasmid) [Tsukamurella tyrosinosolvens]|uniref:XTP/dITP diphosphohydrolase n=1 Tax=Tsukamurella tyrosinosolvens TaxID=57704 RepID=A0A1H4P1L6_TSUTY|nr:MazG family protein [Tsukamurella tyrosinosolvens]SEC01406.1 XTP/dITP diphosphohydrolase [Tsukamurella tyrosinosolvens]VEH99908.1 Nucleoside triphosphate pyrophosphohydrolase [Tsukamurella tyrosinosolvens]
MSGARGTVVLLDPALPTLLPVAALGRLTGPVYYTEELPVRLAWHLPDGRPTLGAELPDGATLLTTDEQHPAAAALRAAGADVIAAPRPAGLAVLDTVELIDRLRREGPWESEQTHASLLRYLVEETYEVADAVAALDAPEGGAAAADELRSELGDLLLQVVFHARIAEEGAHPFGIDDVARTLAAKVRRRTPHLADGAEVDVATQAENWERQKRLERGDRASVLDSISLGQPALALVAKVFERLRTVGFPAELVPEDVRTVTVDPAEPDAAYELDYRRRVLAFMDRVREAEALMASDGVESWVTAWGAGHAGNPEARSGR